MDKKLIINYIYNVLYQVVSVLCPLITAPYVSRVIGENGLGVNAFVNSFVQWFVIFGIMGISTYGIRTIGIVRDDREQCSKTFWSIYKIQVCDMLIALVLYLGILLVSDFEYKSAYFIHTITIISNLLDVAWFFLGIEDFQIASLRNILVKIAGVVCIFLFVKSENDLNLYILINTLSIAIGNGVMLLAVRKRVDYYKVSIKESYQTHFVNNLIIFVPQIATSIYNYMDQTLVGLLSSDWEAQSAFYHQALVIVKMFLYLITSMGTVMLPRISNVHNKGDNQQISSYLNITYNLSLYLSIPLMFGVASVAPFFIPWYLPESFAPISNLILISCPIIVFISLSSVYGTQYLLPIGEMKKYSASVIIGAITNLAMNILLIPKFGAVGACVAVVCAEGSVLLSQILFVKGKLKFNVRLKNYLSYLVSGGLMAIVVYWIGSIMGPRVLTNAVQVVCGMTVYFGMLFILKEDFHLFMFSKLLEILHIRKVQE